MPTRPRWPPPLPMPPELALLETGSPATLLLLAGTAGAAILHTLAGPDHYLPFIVMGRARQWSAWRTVGWTTLCGLGHVGSSVIIAGLGAALGYGLERVEAIESWRGDLAAWGMILFGLGYFIWGVWHSRRPHEHGARLTPWVLFTIFVLGPCEPMIPLVMYPAASGAWLPLVGVVLAFTALTIVSMLAAVLLARRGLALLPLQRLERHTHTIAGVTLLASGCAIQFLGL